MNIKTALLVSMILLSGLPFFAQVKKTAVKFDEFFNSSAERFSSYSVLYERTGRFAERMKREPANRKAVIIFYNQRKGKYPLDGGREWADDARSSLDSDELANERIVLIDGGYREFPTLEFWIVPEGAELPKPAPAFSKNEVVYCPEINVAGDGFRHDRKNPLKFSAAIKGQATNEPLPLEWNVSAGKIVSGQGTDEIQIDLSETGAEKITASVIVKNLPPECDCHAYQTTGIGFFPYLIDEFQHVPYSEMHARFDAFFIALGNEPTMTGYIVIYGDRDEKKKDVARLTQSLRNIMMFRKYDQSRVTIEDGGLREEMWVQFYLLPPGVERPKPTPTVNSDFVVQPSKKVTKKRKKSR